jgi:hypothetical protein
MCLPALYPSSAFTRPQNNAHVVRWRERERAIEGRQSAVSIYLIARQCEICGGFAPAVCTTPHDPGPGLHKQEHKSKQFPHGLATGSLSGCRLEAKCHVHTLCISPQAEGNHDPRDPHANDNDELTRMHAGGLTFDDFFFALCSEVSTFVGRAGAHLDWTVCTVCIIALQMSRPMCVAETQRADHHVNSQPPRLALELLCCRLSKHVVRHSNSSRSNSFLPRNGVTMY